MTNIERRRIIKKKFDTYKKYKFKINYLNILEDNKIENNDENIYMNKYIKMIDSLLNNFNEHNKKFIINVFIENKTHMDLYLAQSTFFLKKKQVEILLCDYLS